MFLLHHSGFLNTISHNLEPPKTQPMLNTSKPTAIDLFCGCGGISVGLEKAGFCVLAGIDIEKKYIASFHHNFPHAKAMTTDITAVSPEDFMREVGIVAGELDLLVGGRLVKDFPKMYQDEIDISKTPKTSLSNHFSTTAKCCDRKWC